MEERFFVFQHSLSAISDLEDYTVDEIFSSFNKLDFDHELLGIPCLFKIRDMMEGLNWGYLTIDQDISADEYPTTQVMQKVNFPVTEYLFKIHEGPFSQIGKTYKKIEEDLQLENLRAIIHPILIFPRGIPTSLSEPTLVEIWTATNAEINGEERKSDRTEIVRTRKQYNFYTW